MYKYDDTFRVFADPNVRITSASEGALLAAPVSLGRASPAPTKAATVNTASYPIT